MKETTKVIRQARPRLSLVAPLTNAICWGYTVVNILLGLGMIFVYRGAVSPIAIASMFSYPQWGVIFLVTGLIMAYSLLRNNWELAKKMQLFGLTVKSVWLIALIFRCFTSPQTILITIVWLFFVYIQAATYTHFMPQLGLWGDKEKSDA